MKTRNGFVSNSSTSSFVLIMTKERYEESIKDYKKEEKKVIDSMASKSKFLGRDIVTFKNLCDRGGESYLYLAMEDDSEEMKEIVDEYTYKMQRAAKKDDSMFFEDIDM